MNTSDTGVDVGPRVSSNQLGQISIWPMFGGEEGVYSCEVAGIVDDTGRTKLKIKTFGVFVGKFSLIFTVMLFYSSMLSGLYVKHCIMPNEV